jgi:hypothetical protein
MPLPALIEATSIYASCRVEGLPVLTWVNPQVFSSGAPDGRASAVVPGFESAVDHRFTLLKLTLSSQTDIIDSPE